MIGRKDIAIIGLLIAIWGLLAFYNMPPIENVQMGWMQISNRVGKTGATIYTDRGDEPNLMPLMRFNKQPTPTEVITIDSLTAFIHAIEESRTTIIYRHGDSLAFVKNPKTWVSYTPTFYMEKVSLRP